MSKFRLLSGIGVPITPYGGLPGLTYGVLLLLAHRNQCQPGTAIMIVGGRYLSEDVITLAPTLDVPQGSLIFQPKSRQSSYLTLGSLRESVQSSGVLTIDHGDLRLAMQDDGEIRHVTNVWCGRDCIFLELHG